MSDGPPRDLVGLLAPLIAAAAVVTVVTVVTILDFRSNHGLGYGEHPPPAQWPNGARIAVQFVVNYEEGGVASLSLPQTRDHFYSFLFALPLTDCGNS